MQHPVRALIDLGLHSGMTLADAEYKAALVLISSLHKADLPMEPAFDAVLGRGSYRRFCKETL